MKHGSFIFFLLVLTVNTYAQKQNLVQNPSFETSWEIVCGYTTPLSGEFDQALSDWTLPTNATSDVHSTLVEESCWNFHPNNYKGIPGIKKDCSLGTQFPRTGNNMIGMLIYDIPNDTISYNNYREYVQGRLSVPLDTSKKYLVEFFTSLGDYSSLASNNLGAWFPSNRVDTNSWEPLLVKPHIYENRIISDSQSWTYIHGVVKPTDRFSYIIIGNFFTDSITSIIDHSTCGGAYYFIDDVAVYELEEGLNVFGPQKACFGETVTLYATGASSYKWVDTLNPDIILSTDSTYTFRPTKTTTFSVKGGWKTLYITVEVLKPSNSLGNDTLLCQGDSILLDVTSDSVTYRWFDNDTNSTKYIDSPGTYWVEVESQINYCTLRDTIEITSPTFQDFADTSLCLEDSLVLNAEIYSSYNLAYIWQDNSTSTNYTIKEPGLYWVQISGLCNNYTDSLIVDYRQCNIIVPNVFTPNGDAINEYFVIEGLQEDIYQLQVFNRWGQIVYQNKDYDNEWNAPKINTGVYYYVLRSDTELYKGLIYVIK